MKKINWGIIGLGQIANKFANAFSIIDNAHIKGIASFDKDKLPSFKKKFASTAIYTKRFIVFNIYFPS